MLRLISSVVVFVGAVVAGVAEPAVDLLDGGGMGGWTFVSPEALAVKDVAVADAEGAVALKGQPGGYLATTASFANYRLKLEWRWTEKPGNGGVLVHISDGPVDRIWPTCLQIQTKAGHAGDLLPMAAAHFAEPLTEGSKIPLRAQLAAPSERPTGEWNAAEITCAGDTIEVRINGVLQNRVTGCVPAAGRIGLQFEGVPYEVRAMTLEPLAAGKN